VVVLVVTHVSHAEITGIDMAQMFLLYGDSDTYKSTNAALFCAAVVDIFLVGQRVPAVKPNQIVQLLSITKPDSSVLRKRDA
jgi:hypothetical protein